MAEVEKEDLVMKAWEAGLWDEGAGLTRESGVDGALLHLHFGGWGHHGIENGPFLRPCPAKCLTALVGHLGRNPQVKIPVLGPACSGVWWSVDYLILCMPGFSKCVRHRSNVLTCTSCHATITVNCRLLK